MHGEETLDHDWDKAIRDSKEYKRHQTAHILMMFAKLPAGMATSVAGTLWERLRICGETVLIPPLSKGKYSGVVKQLPLNEWNGTLKEAAQRKGDAIGMTLNNTTKIANILHKELLAIVKQGMKM